MDRALLVLPRSGVGTTNIDGRQQENPQPAVFGLKVSGGRMTELGVPLKPGQKQETGKKTFLQVREFLEGF